MANTNKKFVVTEEVFVDGTAEYMLYSDGKKHRQNEEILDSFETRQEAVEFKKTFTFLEYGGEEE